MIRRAPSSAAPDPVVVERRVALDGLAHGALKVGRHRLMVAAALFAVVYGVVGLRLVDVTLFNGGFEPPVARAEQPRYAQFARRDIVDRNGVLLATNLPTASLYADPKRVLDPVETANRLARALPGVSRETLLAKLASRRRFVWIKRNLTPRQQDAVNRLGLPGVAFQRADERVYPQGRLFSHVVGFTDIDGRGLAGIEKAFDDALRSARADDGGALRLTLDTRIQYLLRSELARGMAVFRAKGAAGVVMDATGGAVRAMVSLPDFDPNRGRGEDAARFNRVTLGAYEMGSTFKIFTTAMALDAGIVSLRDGYDASKPLRVARFTIRDYKPAKGWLSVPEIFIESSNIGSAKIARDVGARIQRQYLKHLGLLDPAEIELPEVASPLVPSPWREITTMTVGYGHGIAVSPLQLTAAVAAVVNGGVFYPPTLIPRAPGEPRVGWRVISKRTSARMRWLMKRVVEEGTGKKAAVAAYAVGGKTGTAEKPGRGGYRRNALISSFVAAFPIDAPRYVIFVMYDEPKGTKATSNFATGGWTAAPAVARIVTRLGPLAGLPARDGGGRSQVLGVAYRGGEGVAF